MPPVQIASEIRDVGPRTRELLLGATNCPSLNQFGIRLVGTSEARVGFRFERPDPDFVQILACLSGEGAVLVDGVWRRCRRGQAYITPPHVPHGYRAVGNKTWHLVWVMFREDTVAHDVAPRIKVVDAPLIESTFLGLYREQNTSADRSVLASWAHLLYTSTRRAMAQRVHDPRMSELWEIVGRDLSKLWTLDQIAQVGALSPEHLRRLCRATFDRSPMQHLTYLRMRHASELLAISGAKIRTIARLVGYDNPFAFSTAFKREIGSSPSACRGVNAVDPFDVV